MSALNSLNFKRLAVLMLKSIRELRDCAEPLDGSKDNKGYCGYVEGLDAAAMVVASYFNRIIGGEDFTEPISEVKGEKLSNYGDLMTVEDFLGNVECGGFTDYDGQGRYVKDNLMYGGVNPSDVTNGRFQTGYTHIMWYNK